MGRMTGQAIPDPIRPPNHEGPCCNAVISRVRLRAAGLPESLPSQAPGDWAGEGYCTQQCGAQTAHFGEGRCRYHGGEYLEGSANPAYIDGRASRLGRLLPSRYRQDYEEGFADPLVQREQREQLSIIDMFTKESIRRLGTSESGEAWRRVNEHAEECKRLLAKADACREIENQEGYVVAMGELMNVLRSELLPAIRSGAGENEAREELIQLAKERSKLIKVQAAAERTVPVEVLGIVIARTVSIIAEEVTEARILSRLATRLRRETLPGLEGVLNPDIGHGGRRGRASGTVDGTVDGKAAGGRGGPDTDPGTTELRRTPDGTWGTADVEGTDPDTTLTPGPTATRPSTNPRTSPSSNRRTSPPTRRRTKVALPQDFLNPEPDT